MVIKTKISPTAPKYILTIMEDDVEAAEKRKNEIWKAQRSNIALNGYRRGKVPQALAEKVIGYDNLYESYIQELVVRGCAEHEESVVGVGQVVIDIFDKEKPTLIRAEVWLEPVPKPVDEDGNKLYEGIESDSPDTTVSDEEVAAMVQRLRDATATVQDVEREVREGDIVTLDFEGKLSKSGEKFKGGSAKKYELTVGNGDFLPEFEAALLGELVHSEPTIQLTFPEDYPESNIAGKEATFFTHIFRVQEKVMPDLNDDFAKQVGYKNVEDMHTKIRVDLERNKEQQGQSVVDQQLLSGLIQKIPMGPVPQCMIENQVRQIVTSLLAGIGMSEEEYLKKAGITADELKSKYTQQAATDVRARLILKSITTQENLEITPEEEEAALKGVQPQFPGVDLETLRQQIDMEGLRLNLQVNKALEYVREHSVPKKPIAVPTVTMKEPDKAEVTTNE